MASKFCSDNKMKIVVIIGIVLVGLVLLRVADTGTSIADTGTPNNEVTSKASNS